MQSDCLYSSGVRVEREYSGGEFGEEKWYLSFNNHLGSTTAVADFDTGALVEWSTHYAYGAEESHWRNQAVKYADGDGKFNSQAPYTFTGKEEDKEVGLYYFGARYYSAYLGRWLSPDPPVVHGGGVSNHYNYVGNSPYIYVDPDGNWKGWVGIIVSGVVSFAMTLATELSRGTSGINSVSKATLSAWSSASSAADPLLAGPLAGLTESVNTNRNTPKTSEYWSNVAKGTAISSLSSGISKGAGYGIGQIGNAAVRAVVSAVVEFAINVGTSMAIQAAATDEGLTSDNWDDVLIRSSISSGVSAAATAVVTLAAEGISAAGSRSGGAEGGSEADSKVYNYTDGKGNTYSYRGLNAEESRMYQTALNKAATLQGDYPPIKNLGEVPVYRLESMQRGPIEFNTYDTNTIINIKGKDTILLGGSAFANVDKTAIGLLAEFQHTQVGFGLMDRDYMGADVRVGQGIAQMQLNHMASKLGIDHSLIEDVHGGLDISFRASTPPAPVEAYRSNGVLYHNLPDRVWDANRGEIESNWPGWR